MESPTVEEIRDELRRGNRRREAVTVGAAILLGGLVWLGVNGFGAWPGWVLAVLGAGWLAVGSTRQ
jgi:hypothetical protein